MKPDYKLVAKAKYIHANADLASEIWHEVYKLLPCKAAGHAGGNAAERRCH